MKYFAFIAFWSVAATAAVIPVEERVNGENGWYVPHVDGTFEWVARNDTKNYVERGPVIKERVSTNPVTFHLYTRANPQKPQVISASKKKIDDSNFNPEHPTRISIHGWNSGLKEFINTGVRDAWLEVGEYNYIFVEWSRARSYDYASSTYAVSGVGVKVAALVDFLVEQYGLNLETLEIAGHSLGAHVAGFIGKNLKSGKVHKIVGLDPAMPLFSFNKPHQRLANTDGNYVESIHTNGDKLGFLQPIGTGAFYPNGGKVQPGCFLDLTGACSHNRAVDYYTEAIKIDNFISVKCGSYKEAVVKSCGSIYSSIRMGAAVNPYMAAGNFYVPVNSKTPYGMMQ